MEGKPTPNQVGSWIRDHLTASSDHNHSERRTGRGNRLWTVAVASGGGEELARSPRINWNHGHRVMCQPDTANEVRARLTETPYFDPNFTLLGVKGVGLG